MALSQVRHANRDGPLEAALQEHTAYEAVGMATDGIDDRVLESAAASPSAGRR